MRHRVYGKHLGRDTNQRKALLKGLIRSLILHESITTTEAKVRAVKGLIDRLIIKGKENTNQGRSFLQSLVTDKEAGKKLLTEIVPRYPNRRSGFTNLVRLGKRPGDGAMMVKMSLVEGEEKLKSQKSEVKKETKTKRSVVKKDKKEKKII